MSWQGWLIAALIVAAYGIVGQMDCEDYEFRQAVTVAAK